MSSQYSFLLQLLTSLSTPLSTDTMPGEKLSQDGSNEDRSTAQTTYVDLDERRRAALAEIDNASFGYAESVHCLPFTPPTFTL